nr:hypothetical protein [Tanacetum cinerariifolium]
TDLDNILNSRTRQLISALAKAKASCDAIREREVEKDKAYAELKRKCNEVSQDLDKNPLVLDMRAEIKTLQGKVDRLHGEYSRLVIMEKKAAVVTKVILHVATKLIRSDEIDVGGFTSTYFVKYSMATTRNRVPPVAIDNGPTMLIPHLEKGYTDVIDV